MDLSREKLGPNTNYIGGPKGRFNPEKEEPREVLGPDPQYDWMENLQVPKEVVKDNVNHPSHYTWLKEELGIEVIDITKHFDFLLGNTLKYILRAGKKEDAELSKDEKFLEDLEKAQWYLNYKINDLKKHHNK